MKPNFWDKIFIIISKETSFSSGNILHVCICIVQYYNILIVVLFNQNYNELFLFKFCIEYAKFRFAALSCLSPISWTYKNQKLKTNLSDKVLIRAIYVLISVLLSEKDNAFMSSEHPTTFN